MHNDRIVEALDLIGDLLEFQGANPFRVRAYRTGAQKIGDLTESVASIVTDPTRSLTDIQGIGKDLDEKIRTLIATGKIPQLEELKAQVPESVLALLRVPGLGPKKAAALYKELHIATLDQLRAACEAGKVRELKGFGEKTEQAILAGMEIAATATERMYWAHADVLVQEILEHLRACPAVRQIEAAGSYRRGRETVGDLDLLVDSDEPAAVMDCFATYPRLEKVIARGDTKMSIRLDRGMQVDLRVVPANSFGAALQYFTGSKDHNVILRGLAKAKGLKINEYGVFRVTEGAKGKATKVDDPTSGEYVAGRTEEDVYATLGLPCFPPEIREARQEFEWAAAGELPKLVELSDIRGDLHMHTTETDGTASLAEMIAAAQSRGLKYIAITDHSQRVTMARGLDPVRLRQQWKLIDKVNKDLSGFTVLKGIECDILEKGGMDLPDDVLAEADWVVASIHYGQTQPRAQITERMLGAIENRWVSAIAHPTGRKINQRKPYDVDLDAVFQAAEANGKLLELNANPVRLDLDDVACAAAKRHGIKIVIDSDAHSTDGLAVLRYGVLQARRAGLTADDVANTRTWPQMKKLARRG